ncbi:MAG: hypothetical protein GXO35_07560 [Gammaproteobacteria bacterium]|nr:hypothetical protein [Gammaproteobacteria bacterium]
MIIIKPTDFTVDASNIPVNDNPEYDAVTTYSTGDLVSYQDKNYECLTDGTTGTVPSDATKWLDLGATNRMKLFDTKLNTSTELQTEITYSISVAGLVNAIGFLNLDAESVTIEVVDAYEGIVYSKTAYMADIGVEDWWQHYFNDYDYDSSYLALDLPPYAAVTVNITIRSGGLIKCGMCVIGSQKKIGESNYGFSTGITDYSAKTKDVFGETTIIERAYSDKESVTVEINTSERVSIKHFLASIRATPTIFVTDKNTPGSYVFGFYKDFQIVVPNSIKSICSLEIEGMI